MLQALLTSTSNQVIEESMDISPRHRLSYQKGDRPISDHHLANAARNDSGEFGFMCAMALLTRDDGTRLYDVLPRTEVSESEMDAYPDGVIDDKDLQVMESLCVEVNARESVKAARHLGDGQLDDDELADLQRGDFYRRRLFRTVQAIRERIVVRPRKKARVA